MKHVAEICEKGEMIMTSTYEEMFLLYLFSAKQARKETSIYYLLQGKRTASMLYRTVDYQLEAIFGLFPKLDRSVYQNRLEKLIQLNYVSYSEESKEALLTLKGKEVLEVFFNQHYLPHQLNWMRERRVVLTFQKVIYFLTQILSEARYQNKRYIPIEKNVALQQWTKQWLRQQKKDYQDLALQFGLEWKKILSQIEPDTATLIVYLMTGHQMTGLTKKQLAQKMSIEEAEVHIRWLDGLSQMVHQIDEIAEQVPLLNSILMQIKERSHQGLSKSAQETQLLVQQGHTVEQVCNIRRLKKSTVYEHLIELVIVYPELEISAFMPATIYASLNQLWDENSSITYQEALERLPDMEFYWFRMMQIERRRKHDSNI